MNYVVYGNDGIYKLASDDPNFLFAVNQKRGKGTVGTVYSQVRLMIENYRANPDPALLAELDGLREWLTGDFGARITGLLNGRYSYVVYC